MSKKWVRLHFETLSTFYYTLFRSQASVSPVGNVFLDN